MKQKRSFLTTMFLLLFTTYIFADSPQGLWNTIDDITGKKRAIVRLNITDGVMSGTIVSVIPEPGDTGKCVKCEGLLKDKPIKGLRFIWGLKDHGHGEWGGGEILDPKTGKVYRAKVLLKDKKLYVRGYLGVSLFGRTQVWVR